MIITMALRVTRNLALSNLLLVAAGLLALGTPMYGQESAADLPDSSIKPTFEVVSVKSNRSGGSLQVTMSLSGYSATSLPIRLLLCTAYGISTCDLTTGLPGWVESERFDVRATTDADTALALQKLPAKQKEAQLQLMLQSLLVDRFKLRVHRETKELPMYALVVAKRGFKLKESSQANEKMMTGPGIIRAQGMTLASLANSLPVGRLVIDKTGLTGKYDITLRWAPDEMREMMTQQTSRAMPSDSGPSIFTALQEQLGLKLESQKSPQQILVVDHIERPSEN